MVMLLLLASARESTNSSPRGTGAAVQAYILPMTTQNTFHALTAADSANQAILFSLG